MSLRDEITRPHVEEGAPAYEQRGVDQLDLHIFESKGVKCPWITCQAFGWTREQRDAGLPCRRCQFYGRKTLPPLCPDCRMEPAREGEGVDPRCLACRMGARILAEPDTGFRGLATIAGEEFEKEGRNE